jgi:hypothetical protein
MALLSEKKPGNTGLVDAEPPRTGLLITMLEFWIQKLLTGTGCAAGHSGGLCAGVQCAARHQAQSVNLHAPDRNGCKGFAHKLNS